MKTPVLGPLPPEIERFVERRKALGQGTYDEVWEGTYHLALPARGVDGYLDDQLARLLGPYADKVGILYKRCNPAPNHTSALAFWRLHCARPTYSASAR